MFPHRAAWRSFSFRSSFALISSLFLLGAPVARAQTTLPDLGIADALGADIFQHSGATGMVLVVVRDKQVLMRGYGETAPRSHQPPQADSVVRLCSLTKIFTTDVFSKLAADGTVHWDDPLQKYAPANVVVPRRTQSITLENLATHTAALPREIGWPPDGTPHFTYPDYATRWQWLPHRALPRVPGTTALYSNIGFDLLSDALQSAAHKPYATVLSERTLQPLRMWQTTYYPTASQCARLLVPGHDEGPCVVTENTQGSSGLYSTPIDMANWLKYLVGGGEPILPTQSNEAQAVRLSISQLHRATGFDYAGEPSGLGLGWVHLHPEGYPAEIIEKTGGGAGFLTYIAFSRERQTAIFVALTIGRNWPRFPLFKESNEILTNVAGLPSLPREDVGKPVRRTPRKATQPAPHAKAAKPATKPAARTAPRKAAKPPVRPKTHHGAAGPAGKVRKKHS